MIGLDLRPLPGILLITVGIGAASYLLVPHPASIFAGLVVGGSIAWQTWKGLEEAYAR